MADESPDAAARSHENEPLFRGRNNLPISADMCHISGMGNANVETLVSAIARLGFSELEAATYHALLRAPASTGYRIAKLLCKPHANVYQALNGLERKGAVIFEDEAKRVYSAVPPSEVFARLRQRFEEESGAVEKALENVGVEALGHDRLFHLVTRQQVLDRARTMIAGARECILVYAPPADFVHLRPSLEAAVARGVRVAGVMMRDEDLIPGSQLVVSHVAEAIVSRWDNLPVIVVADACEMLVSDMVPDSDNVSEAIWTRNRLVTALFHNGIVSDIVLHGLPAIERITSPNTYLLGEVPRALRELYLDRTAARATSEGDAVPSAAATVSD